ncbi:MAG: pentapeptide repeat-containing protein [Pseudanabaena sp. Salubria-1]|nr:pentapeptide repeat-containing protein [Pseudanabaena sp. Salubria-1]
MTSTAKTFAGQNLRGRSFKGQDLSGADFSDTDLRGANFTGATLIGANFSKAETGVQKRWVAFQLVISFFLSELAGIFVAYTGAWVTIFFAPRYIPSSRIATGIAMIITLIIIFFAIVRQGFTVKAFGTMTWTLALVAFAYALSGSDPLVVLFAGAVVALAVVVFSVALALSEAGSFIAWLGLFLGLFQGGFVGAFAVSWSGAGSFDFALIGAGFGAVVTALLSVYTAGRALKGDPKFDELLKFIVGFASIGGTSFQGADLTKANFTKAYLKSSDFRNSRKQRTNLTRTIWKQAKELDRSRLGTSILSNLEVRELLVTGNPNQAQSYEGLNLYGANLDGVYLKEVNFKRAILNEASFCNANLESVNFTEAQVIGTDFTGAQMTGVCLEGWNYDHTTKLDDVDSLELLNTKGDWL